VRGYSPRCRGLASDLCGAARKLLEHRMSDGIGTWTSRDALLTLGHARLSIIGLKRQSADGDPDGPVHVVMNDEFRSDREVASGCEPSAITSPPRATSESRCTSTTSSACRPRRYRSLRWRPERCRSSPQCAHQTRTKSERVLAAVATGGADPHGI
jgi:hypothetical protein